MYKGLLSQSVLEIVRMFEEQDHSGMSAGVTVDILQKLLRFEPLTPLHGRDEEWMEIAEGKWQNKRCSHVFKDGNDAYDAEGKIFREPNGTCFQSIDSHVPITFPYTPTREYVDVT